MVKFSIIIPNYNDPRIRRTIKSIVDQDYDNYEIIVVDSCSNNEEVTNCYQEFASNIGKLIVEKDRGIFDALNKGITASSGDYIYLLGSDDYLIGKSALTDVSNVIDDNSNIDGVCIGCSFFDSKGKVVRTWNTNKVGESYFRFGILPPHFSLFLSKELYGRVGLFDIDFSPNVAGDTEWLLRMGKFQPSILTLPKHSTMMEVGGTSTGSFKNILKGVKLNAIAAKKHGYTLWFAIPFIKIFSKLGQFKYV